MFIITWNGEASDGFPPPVAAGGADWKISKSKSALNGEEASFFADDTAAGIAASTGVSV